MDTKDKSFFEMTYQKSNFNLACMLGALMCAQLDLDVSSHFTQFIYTSATIYLGATRSLKSYGVKKKVAKIQPDKKS